jgi:hypothetical protein
MKNLFIVFFLVFTAQLVFGQNFSFGLKAGANVNQWYFKPAISELGVAFSYDKAISYLND